MTRFKLNNPAMRNRQKGAITMFSAVLILILLTEVIIYAVQVGVFEQRKSSNEMRQKLAFHAADSAIQEAKQFMLANSEDVASTLSGAWLDAAGGRWKPCSTVTGTTGTHPCFGEPVAALRAGTYYYDDGSNTDEFGNPALPLNPDALSSSNNEKTTLYALLCMLDIDRSKDPIVQGCTTDAGKQDNRYYMITLLARGEADCDNSGANCNAEALVAEKIGSFGPGGGEGGPGVPLTARTMVPPSGTVEVVPNPNGGGVGVPISVWVPTAGSCGLSGDPVDPISGSYSTCERHEFYGMPEFPADYKCPTPNCSCSKTEDRLISYADGNERILGIDIVPDPNFHCDLWEYTFGVSKADYQLVKDMVKPSHVLTDCDSLDVNSSGIYWITGPVCDFKTQVGTYDRPVLLISAAADTRVNAGASMFGVLFVTNAEVAAAGFTGNGKATIYGAAIMDAEMDHFNGTFQIVYIEKVIKQAFATGAFGAVAGGWTDFHNTWQ